MAEVTTRLTTYKDLLDNVHDYLGASVTGDAVRDCRRAVQNGYRGFASMFNWSYYYSVGRIVTNASYQEGTIAYDHEGGTYERQLTLTAGTWPAWAYLGDILIDGVIYELATLETSTVATLAANANPGEDIAAGTTYTLFRDSYPMPIDFQAADDFVFGNHISAMSYVHPSEWLEDRAIASGSGVPRLYTFTSDPNYYGTIAVRLSPAPQSAWNFDYVYKRRPRPLLVEEYKEGTASITLASATVTGTGTNWKDNYIGSIIRFSEVANKLPTGRAGDNPFEVQRTIVAVTSPTQMTLDRVVRQTFTGAKYTISDPVDVEDGAMLTGLFREIEKELRILRRMKAAPEEEARYRQAIIMAREADERSFADRVVSSSRAGRSLWKGSVSEMIG